MPPMICLRAVFGLRILPASIDDVVAVARCRKSQAGQDTLAVDDDRARAAGALIAAFLSTGQAEPVANSVQKRHARVQREFVRCAVDANAGVQRRSPCFCVHCHNVQATIRPLRSPEDPLDEGIDLFRCTGTLIDTIVQ